MNEAHVLRAMLHLALMGGVVACVAGATVGAIVLPLMLFHQVQLMVCAVLAQRYARQAAVVSPGSSS